MKTILFTICSLALITFVIAQTDEKSIKNGSSSIFRSPTHRFRGISKTNDRLEQVSQELEGAVKGRPTTTRRPLPTFSTTTRNPLEPPSDVRKKFNVLLRTSSGFNDKEGIAVSSGRTAVN